MTVVRRCTLLVAARAAVALVVIAGGARIVGAVDIALTPFATGLSAPVAISNAGDSRLFVVEQAGHIRVVQSDGTVLGTDFLDIHTLVSCCGEQGLLGLAFHPNYFSNGFFYIYYTDLGGDIAVARYSVSGNPVTSNVANPGSGTPVIGISHPSFSNHNGGDLHFGPDGYLYIGPGDGGSGCGPGDRSQNAAELLGKILRIDIDTGSPYGIPPSNPFAGSMTNREEIWALGMRNPFRFSFDRANGNLYIADVGQNALEEIDFQPAASAGGENYGWNCYEGDSLASASSGCMSMATCAPSSLFTFPVHTYDHGADPNDDGLARCSVIGGYVYRGTQSPTLAGHYFFADYCSSDFYSLTTPDNGTTWNLNWLGVPVSGLMPTTLGEGTDGEVYVGGQGSDTIYRITAPTPPAACPSEPATSCTATTKAQLKINNPGDASKKKLLWKWQNGPALNQSDFGNPIAGTSYTLCIYGGTGAAKITAGIPAVTGWKTVSSVGYKFKDKTGGDDGVFKALLKGGEAGKSKLLVKAKGGNLDLTAMPFSEMVQVRTQLMRNDAAACWEAVFPAAAIDVDDASQFKAKIP